MPPFRSTARILVGLALGLALPFPSPSARAASVDFEAPPHRYFERTPTDRFTRLEAAFVSGQIPLDRTNELTFLRSLLKALEIPESSQLLVYSTTSLQLSLISPANPRALYFSDDLSVGFIPGGRIELTSLDPELGAIFHIFDIPRGDGPLRPERARRCMNCHANEDTEQVPGLVVKSVVPGPGGGSLDAFRQGRSGHDVPLADRLGGWHLTGADGWTNHWANLTGRLKDGEIERFPNPPGVRFRWDRYPVATSDALAHLVHEHQVGFVNRAVALGYQARQWAHEDGATGTAAHQAALESGAEKLLRYLLFADEVPLPAGGVAGDPQFRKDFGRTQRAVAGRSLREFELQTRLFKHRCSYMIYSPVFQGLPAGLKLRLYQRLGEVLRDGSREPDYAYLPVAERAAIRDILRATLTDLPPGW
jgi:hypothetical protein